MEKPSIYVADLAAYNNGYLHGVWIDATQELDNIWDQVKEMLKASPVGKEAEEWAIHDYMGFEGVYISEHQCFETARELALFVEERGELGAKVLDQFGGDIEQAGRALEESYAGEYKNLADFAEELTTDTSEVPQHLEYYIDYEAMGRDLELGGDVYSIELAYEEVHIFWNY